MIKVTRLDGTEIVVNADLIEFVEGAPDTRISLTTGRTVAVREPLDEVIQKAVAYRRSARSYAVAAGGPGAVFSPLSG